MQRKTSMSIFEFLCASLRDPLRPLRLGSNVTRTLRRHREFFDRLAGAQMINQDNHASLVEFRDVSFAVNGGRPIIDRLSLQVQHGETFVLLGESGCGKTTTLKLVNRLLTPTSGKVLVEEKATTDWDVI